MSCSAVLKTEWLHIHSSFEHGPPISTKTTSDYELFRILLVATRGNKEQISSATSFSSFWKSKRRID